MSRSYSFFMDGPDRYVAVNLEQIGEIEGRDHYDDVIASWNATGPPYLGGWYMPVTSLRNLTPIEPESIEKVAPELMERVQLS